jgi:hypothetical protein
MNLLKRTFIATAIVVSIFLISCEENEMSTIEKKETIRNPIARKDPSFPNGVLQFNTTASFKSFYDKAEKDQNDDHKITSEIQTLKTYLNNYNISKAKATVSSRISTDEPLEVDSTEFINDMKSFVLPIENLANVVNPDMQVIVGDSLYQFTRIGLFKVSLANLSDYIAFYNTNKNNIFFDANYEKTPSEIPIGNDQYLVQPGIIRVDDAANDILSFRQIEYIDDGGGCTAGCGGGGGGGTGGGGSTDYYVNTTVGASFDKEVGIIFNDWAKRRLVFKTQKIDIAIGGYGFHKIDVKAKVQREKKFLWFTYWGPSYADEIIVGVDNMSLETDYIFPYPQQFSTMTRPTFDGLADFEIGNWVVHTLNLKVNLSALGYSLNNGQVSSFVNHQFNSVVGNIYNNIFKQIETNLINSIDPSYLSTYANYTTRVASLNDQHRLKWAIGKAEKPQGYSHVNTWRFDWNVGIGEGYSYDMKSGSFFGKARVGNVWHGIRIVRI